MRFFGRGRGKERINGEKDQVTALGNVLDEVYATIFVAAATSASAVNTISDTKWNAKLAPFVQARVHCEFYYFYAHVMDRFAFQELGEQGRDFFVDAIVDLGLTPLIKHSFPDAGEESWQRLIHDELENFNSAQDEYATCRIFMLKQTEKPFEDAFSDNPEALGSRLFQNITEELEKNSPELDASPTDAFLAIHAIVLEQFTTMSLEKQFAQAAALI